MAEAGIRLTDRPGSKDQIAEVVFGTKHHQYHSDAYQPYFDYYVSEIDLLHRGFIQEARQIAALATQDCEGIFFVVDVLRKHVNLNRSNIRCILEKKFTIASTSQLNRSIDLAIRLWLMIYTQDEEFETLRPGTTCVAWEEDESLEAFVISLFPRPVWELNASISRLSPYFTAAFMLDVCGLQLEWTASIHDHLCLDRKQRKVKIFAYKCHVNALLAQHDDEQCIVKPPIPRKVLHETLLSLELLFPFWDNDTIKLLHKEGQNFHTTSPFLARAMSLQDFTHWRDRLLELQDVLQSPPISLKQLWRDRRNPQQFWTFWIALVVLLTTFVSMVTGIIATWAAVQALRKMS